MTKTFKQDQTIYDMVIQSYGSIDSLFDMISDNPQLLNYNIHGVLRGVTIESNSNNGISNYFTTNNISITTGQKLGIDNVDITARSADDSFDLSFG